LNLAERGCLAVLWGKGSGKIRDARFLDPTPEYARQLRLGAVIHSHQKPIPRDISEIAILSLREVAVIMGWTLKYAQKYTLQNHVPHIKAGAKVYLYTAATVRELLWKREGRTMAGQRAPFLIPQLIEWFQKWYAEDRKNVPTDAEFLADEEIQRKLLRIVDMEEKDQSRARADFAQKTALAQKIAQILQSVKPT
jgi:hypothetical protein